MLMILACLFPALAGTLVCVSGMQIRTRNRCLGACVLATDLLCAAAALQGGRVSFLTLAENLHMTFAADDMGIFFLAAVLLLYTAVCFYAFEYMEREERTGMFFSFYFLSFGALIAVCFAGNLLTLYFCFEMLTLLSMPMVLQEMTKEAIAAALKYLFYSIAGALMGLFAVFFVYFFAEGSAEFVRGGFLDAAKIAGHEAVLLAAVMAGISGFGTKAGLYPMHGWLPTAHPIAPAPASALLSGIIAKAGVIAVIRLVYYSVGEELIRGTWVQYAWMTLAMLTIFIAGSVVSLGGWAEGSPAACDQPRFRKGLPVPLRGRLHLQTRETPGGRTARCRETYAEDDDLLYRGVPLPGGHPAHGRILKQMGHRFRCSERRHGRVGGASAGDPSHLGPAHSGVPIHGGGECVLSRGRVPGGSGTGERRAIPAYDGSHVLSLRGLPGSRPFRSHACQRILREAGFISL